MPRPKVHDDALRFRLLEQAVRTLSEDGPDGLSLRKLATQAETSTTAVYSLFGGKPGLLNAVYNEAFHRFGKSLDEADGAEDPGETLCAIALAYRASALHEPHFYRVMFSPGNRRATTDAGSLRRAEATYQPLRDVVRRAVAAGLFREGSLDVLATSIWGTVHGLVSLELDTLLPTVAGEPVEVYRGAVLALCTGWRRADPNPSS